MLELYPDRLQYLLLYATRARRGLKISTLDSRQLVINTYIEMVKSGRNFFSMEEFLNSLSEKQKIVVEGQSEKQRGELTEVLSLDWRKILTGTSRDDVSSIEKQFQVSTKDL